MTKLKLALEPRPISTWGITLASRLPPGVWDTVRRKVFRAANFTCEICSEDAQQLHCHEEWDFNERKKVQQLVALRCVCKTCHDVIHFGRSKHVYNKTYVEALIQHWCKVNKKTRSDFERHLEETHRISKRRANKQYVVVAGDMILT